MEDNNQNRMPQQADDAQRQQAGQQNQQGETRQPQQQQDDRQQAQPGQQNQQGERDRRQAEGQDDLNNNVSGGVDTGAIEPGRTGDGGAER